MSDKDKERENFLHGAFSRAPGKRQIKPTSLATEDYVLHDSDDSDEEFVDHENSDVSDEDGSDESSENEGENEDQSDEESSAEDTQETDAKPSTAAGKPEPLICSICLNMRNSEGDCVIQCDKCGVSVHEGCYAVSDPIDDQASVISNFSTDPWFCECCVFNLEKPPRCELCPSQFGAFKRSDVGGKWIHLNCGIYTPGISFGDIENLSAISWQEIDFKRFGRKACDGCTNILEARTGITTPCEAGFCKHNYHISCAQRLGLLVDAESDNLPEHSNKHVDPHFLLCRTHNIHELVLKKRQNYAIFLRQEHRRFIGLNRRMLCQRESFKLERQRKQYDERIKDYKNVTIHMPALHNKRSRLLQSSPDFLEAFAEKAELFGVSLQEFTDGFTRLPPSQITYLPPSFSTEFVKYFEHREQTIFAEEAKRLHEDECELKKVEQAEKDLKLLIEKMSAKTNDNPRAAKQRTAFEHKFISLCRKLNMTIEQEEDMSSKEDNEPPKLKRQKLETSPTTKRLSNENESDSKSPRKSLRSDDAANLSTSSTSHKDSAQKSKSQSATTNFRQLKNGNWRKRRNDRASVDSIDSNLETEDSTPSPIMPSSESSPPCLKNIDEDSVTSEQSLNDRPILVPMISSTTNESVNKRFPLILYKRILRLHYGLPKDLRLMGDTYVKSEFRLHKEAGSEQALLFLKEWTEYCTNLSKQLSNKGITKGIIGKDFKPNFLDNFSDEQIRQLYELKCESVQWKDQISQGK